MLKNYLLVAWRNITRQKVYSIINVLGLALGICACLVIFLVSRYDFSFDHFHSGQERISPAAIRLHSLPPVWSHHSNT